MSIKKVKSLYEAKKMEVNAVADADYKPFLKWLAENRPQLYAETLTANAAHKQPKKLIMKVMYEYMQWKADGGK